MVDERSGVVTPVKGAGGTVLIDAILTGGEDGPLESQVTIDFGNWTEADDLPPADSLKVEVVYSQDPDTVMYKKEYTPSSIQSVGSGMHFQKYTQFRNDGQGWQTLIANGVYLKDLMSDVGVKNTADIEKLLVSSVDKRTPTEVGGVFATGYYYPNYGDGSKTSSGAVAATPMIGVTTYTGIKDSNPSQSLMDSKKRFRICTGAQNLSDNNSAYRSREKVYALKVVLKGAPPVDFSGGNGTGNGTGDGSNPNGGKDGVIGVGGRSDSDNPLGDSDSNGVADSKKKGSGGDEGTEKGSHSVRVVEGLSNDPSQDALSDAAPDVGSLSQAANAFGDSDSSDSKEKEVNPENSKRWQVFEMMTNNQTDFDIDFFNPLEPFFIPGCLLLMGVGAYASVRRFKRQGGTFHISRPALSAA